MGGLPPLPFVAPYMSSEIYSELIPPPRSNKRKLDMAFVSESSTSLDTQGDTMTSANVYKGPSAPPPPQPLSETISSQPSTSKMQIDSQPLPAARLLANIIPEATISTPSIPGLGSNIQMRSPSVAVENIVPTTPRDDLHLSHSSNHSEPRSEIVSSESETCASSASIHSGFTSLSSAPSEDVMQSAEAFIQNAICGKPSSGGAASGSMSIDARRQYLEEKIRVVKEGLLRKKKLEAAAARTKKETSNPSEDEQLPALPAIATRERLLSAQISRMTILLQKLKTAITPGDKSRITKLVRCCEDEYQTRLSALPPINSCAAVSSSSAQFIWPSYMETEIWISDDEDE